MPTKCPIFSIGLSQHNCELFATDLPDRLNDYRNLLQAQREWPGEVFMQLPSQMTTAFSPLIMTVAPGSTSAWTSMMSPC